MVFVFNVEDAYEDMESFPIQLDDHEGVIFAKIIGVLNQNTKEYTFSYIPIEKEKENSLLKFYNISNKFDPTEEEQKWYENCPHFVEFSQMLFH